MGRVEQDVAELSAGHEHTRATVVLGDVLGNTERGGGRGSPLEVHHGALISSVQFKGFSHSKKYS